MSSEHITQIPFSFHNQTRLESLPRFALSTHSVDAFTRNPPRSKQRASILFASLIHALIPYPKLNYLNLSHNCLGCSQHPSRLLSQLCIAASSSPLTLRILQMDASGLTPECCGPVVERLLSLGSRGLQSLLFGAVFSLLPMAKTLIQTISKDNLFIQVFDPHGWCELEWKDEEEGLESSCTETLYKALERNRLFEHETHKAALRILKLARIVLLGSPAPPPSLSVLIDPAERTHNLELPPEILQLALSFVNLSVL